MTIGYQHIIVNKQVGVGLTYVRSEQGIEFLEGWVNPFIATQLTKQTQLLYIDIAKRMLLKTRV